MRFLEFAGDDTINVVATVLRNYASQASDRDSTGEINYPALTNLLRNNGIYLDMDYDVFNKMFDSSELIKSLTHNFNSRGITLNVSGVSKKDQDKKRDSDSKDDIEKIASSNAEKNLD